MRRLLRYRMLALVFMLVVSNLALAGHVTAHFQPQWAECELCMSKAQPTPVIPVSDHSPEIERSGAESSLDAMPTPHNASFINPSQPRAPPIPSS